jgi:hypothetical protein
MVGRATINYGVRMDGVKAYLPEQSSPAGTFVGERSFAKTDVYDFNFNIAPRIGLSYDLVGNGRTAVKAYYGRFYNQFGSEIAEAANRNARINVTVPWNDSDGDLQFDPGELNLSAFTGFNAVFPRVDGDATRPYSDEFNVGVDHQLVRDLGLSVSYHRRQHRNGLGTIDLLRPPSAYTAVSRTYTDPSGAVQPITVYNLDPALIRSRDRIVTNVDGLESDYNGVQFSVNKRMSNRWQLLAGLTLQHHEGFSHDGTFTDSNNTVADLNDPNFRLNRDASAVFTDIPWTFSLSGSYQLPYDITFSGKYTARDGDPLRRLLTVTGLNQGSETVWVQQRGEDRTETVSKFVDIRFGKRLRMGWASLEGTVDVFNLLNANHVLLQTETIGTTFGRPSRILAPRIVRFGVTARF